MSAPLAIAAVRSATGIDGYGVFPSKIGEVVASSSEIGKYTDSRLTQYRVSPNVSAADWGQTTQFVINPGISSKIIHAMLDVTVSNTSATDTVTPKYAGYLADNIQLCIDGSAAPTMQISADALQLQFERLSPTRIAGLVAGNAYGMTSQFALGAAIPVSSTVTYTIKLDTFICKVPPKLLGAPITMNVNWAQNPVDTGDGTLRLVSSVLKLHVLTDPATDLALSRQVSSYPLLLSYATPDYYTYNIILTAGQAVTQPLPGLRGAYTAMVLMIRAAQVGVAGAGYRTFTALDVAAETNSLIDLQTSTGISLLGSGAISGRTSRYTIPSMHTSGGLQSQVNPMYWLMASPTPGEDLSPDSDSVNGIYNLDGTSQLQLTPSPASGLGGAYILTIVAYRQSCLSLSSSGVLRALY